MKARVGFSGAWAAAPLFALLTTLGGDAARAHHSTAEFDYTQEVKVVGSVKEFRWANPHIWLYVTVPNGNGGTTEWAFESGAPNVSARMGWRKDSLKPGASVSISACPTREGKPTGTIRTVTLEDGTVLYGVAYAFSNRLKAAGGKEPTAQ